MRTSDEIVVLGSGSFVADYLLPRLMGRCGRLVLVSRHAPTPPPSAVAVAFDSVRSGVWGCPPGAVVICLQPLPTLIPVLPRLASAARVVALGSTRRFSNAASPDAQERAAAQALVDAEADLVRWCAENGIPFTVLRPTLIYDMKRDMNLARMAAAVRRFGILPLARPACGLRQPIHADDVAKAIIGALDHPEAENRAFNIAGSERLTYRAMAERVFRSLDRRPRLAMLPLGVLALGFRLGARSGLIGDASLGTSVFRRMNEDLVFDVADGLRVLRYDPRPFAPSPPAT